MVNKLLIVLLALLLPTWAVAQNLPAPSLPLAGTEQIGCVQGGGYVKCTPANLWNVINGVSQPNNTSFWVGYPTGGTKASIDRLTSRVFMGAASYNDGGPTTNLDWLGVMAGLGYINGDELNFAQAASLTDPSSTAANGAYPIAGFLAAANATNSLSGSTPRALESIAVLNAGAGKTPSIWSYYSECHLISNGSNCYGFEVETRNAIGAPGSNWTPYNLPIGTANELGCGAGIASTYACNVALYIAANPNQFNAGLSFLPGSIAPVGYASESPAIQMPHDYDLAWYSAGGQLLGLTADGFGNPVFIAPGGGIAIKIDDAGTTYTGVTCSGSPSGSFATVGGIVTHC